MPEQYVNYPATTTVASGGYTAGSGVLNVASTGAPFPSLATFRVVVQSRGTGLAEVLLEVTAINSGTQWAVTAEGTDSDAIAGDNVYAVLSAGALTQLRSDASMTGPFAGLPVTVPLAGTRYRCTDCAYEFVSNGSAWLAWYQGIPVTVPPLASTFATAGTGSIAQGTGSLIMTGSASLWSAFTVASPSVPFTLEVGILFLVGGVSASAGITTSDGTKYEYEYLGGSFLDVDYFSALNTSASVLVSQTTDNLGPPLLFLRMTLDSTHRTYYIGDGSAGGWVRFYQEAATANLTTSEVGLAINGGSQPLPAQAQVVSFNLS